jgi:hypothetical protein
MKRRVLLLGGLLLLACRDDLDAPAVRAPLDEPFFRCNVQPVLAKNCSTFACHGDDSRYFRVYARNRLRYGIAGEAERNAKLNDHERRFNYESARAYVESGGDSLLLKKPLEAKAGGFFHRGATKYAGGNVFATADDPEYRVLVDWTMGKTADPACIAPGEDQ